MMPVDLRRFGHACRGIIPAATGNFVSHGIRTFSYEASFTGLSALTGGAAELQVKLTSPGMSAMMTWSRIAV